MFDIYLWTLCHLLQLQKKKRQEERKEKEMEEKKKVQSEDKHKPLAPVVTTESQIQSAEGHTNSYTRLRKTSDIDEISLLFEDALEYQDDDIDDILAELAATNDNDDGTLKGYCEGEVKGAKGRSFHAEEMLDLVSVGDQKVICGEDSESEKEIMIDCPPSPYVNMPPAMKKIGNIVMPPYELEYHMNPVREDTETIAPPGCATIGHSPTYQRSAFDAYRRHRPQSLDGGTMENQQVDIKMISRLQLTFFLMHGTVVAAAYSP